MKRFIAIFLALLMMAAVLPVPASAEESDDYEESEVPLPYDGALCGDHLSWAVEAGTLTISGTGDMYDFESETDVPWFESYTEIESIDLGPDVTGIGNYAFLGCTGVSVLTVPAGICRIGVYAFGSTVRILGVSGSAAETFSLENGNPFTPLISQPVITSLSNSVGGVTVTWSSSDGAQLYRIFRKSVSTDWMPLADTESCIYFDSSVESGTEYAYTVQCYSGDGLYATSSRNEDGVSITYIAAPPITGIAAVGGGVHITWEKVSGAVKYRVFRKTEGGTWTRIGDTAGTSITFGGAVKGTEYRYTVRCIDAAGNYVSSYYSDGTAFTMSDTPRVTGVNNTVNGVRITWTPVSGAERYRVYRKTGNGGWGRIGETASSSFTDTCAVSGTAFSYTVRCLDQEGILVSDYDPVGLTITYVAAPKITGISAANSGVQIVWGKVGGAVKYRVFRKTDGGTWTRIGDTDKSFFTDLTAVTGTEYRYTVRCIGNTGNYTSSYYSDGPVFTMSETPAVSSAVNTVGGVKITWTPVSGADRYRVYRKTGNGSWGRIGETETFSFTDSAAVSGTSYSYTVRCLDSSGILTSDYDPVGTTVSYIAAPVITGISAANSGVHIVWGKVGGAVKYRVFRKTESGTWTRVGDTDKTSLTDLTAVTGTEYRYTVRCIDNSGNYTSSYYSDVPAFTLTPAPVLTGITNFDGGIRISWSHVSGAAKYRIYRKTGSGSWGRIGETTGAAFSDTSVASGAVYSYTVRCLDSSGILISDYDPAGMSLSYVGVPDLCDIDNTCGGVRISWENVKAAVRFRVYRKTGGGIWSRIGETTSNSFTDTEAVSGTLYSYTVRSIDSYGNLSTYDPGGISITFVAAPSISSIGASNGGIRITWSHIDGAARYRILRRTGSGDWREIGDTTAASYTDTTAETGTNYIYTVQCLDADGSPVSDYDPQGRNLTMSDTPVISSLSNVDGGIRIAWSAVSGAVYYRVFRRSADGSWKGIGSTSGTYFTDTSTVSGTVYTYTVRCVNTVGDYQSDYDHMGKSIICLSAPVISAIRYSMNVVCITWNAVDGAASYRVYRKTGGGGWSAVGDTTDTSYSDATAEIGTLYTYTVRAIDDSGKVFSSYNNGAGIKARPIRIYLSPSNQDENTFITGNANEGDVWNDIASRLLGLLSDYECEVMIADYDMVLDDRAEFARQWDADVYVAMHSNAYVRPNSCWGVEVYYDANKEDSAEREVLATELLNELSTLFLNRGLRQSSYLKECRLPEMPSVIVECGYHDSTSDANLILNNKDRIAQLYCNALVKYLILINKTDSNP